MVFMKAGDPARANDEHDAEEGSGELQEPAPRSHRRPGPAAVDWPPPIVRRVLWENPRQPMGVAVGVLLSLSLGVSMAASGNSVPQRALGGVAVVAGALVLAS